MSERVEKARKAYAEQNLEEVKRAHTKEAIEKEHKEKHQTEKGKYIGDMVYGALDGIITTFSVVAGAAGATLSMGVVLIMGFANLLGDGLSMGVGNYLSTKSELDYAKKERMREGWEVDHIPAGEREEIRTIMADWGFRGKDLKRATDIITSDKNRWVDMMMEKELGISEVEKNPLEVFVITFLAFLGFGLIPLLSYLLTITTPAFRGFEFGTAILLTLVSTFTLGALRTLVIQKKWWKAGIEMMLLGGGTALVAYYVGEALSFLA